MPTPDCDPSGQALTGVVRALTATGRQRGGIPTHVLTVTRMVGRDTDSEWLEILPLTATDPNTAVGMLTEAAEQVLEGGL